MRHHIIVLHLYRPQKNIPTVPEAKNQFLNRSRIFYGNPESVRFNGALNRTFGRTGESNTALFSEEISVSGLCSAKIIVVLLVEGNRMFVT